MDYQLPPGIQGNLIMVAEINYDEIITPGEDE